MKLRYRAPAGGGSLNLPEDATVDDLVKAVIGQTGFTDVVIKYGWPPREVPRENASVTCQSLGLQKESLTVAARGEQSTPQNSTPKSVAPTASGVSGTAVPSATKIEPLKDRNISIEMLDRSSSLVLRVMPDDNSCLFTAIGGALPQELLPEKATPAALRSQIARHVLDNQDKFTKVVLENKEPWEYAQHIQRSDVWGGYIELSIFSELYNVEIDVVDVKNQQVLKYGEGLHEECCILVYSNIHYDRLAESFVPDAPEADITRWRVEETEGIIAKAKELCRKLKDEHHYFTDTSDFVVTCNQCGWVGQGEKAVADHARQTGHTNIQEIQDFA